MNYSRTDRDQLSKLHSALQDDNPPRNARESFWSRRRRVARESAAENQRLRRERDIERGYRINVKQVVLAFGIEFFIIGIGLTGWYFFSPKAMLYPLALALVELARVPLAIAVRTQKSWNIQFAALLGVAAAVVVTSTTLYQIGELTFSPRRAAVYEKLNALEGAKQEREAFLNQRKQVQTGFDQINKDWTSLSETYNALSSKLNDQSAFSKNCKTVETPSQDGSSRTTSTSCGRDPAFLALQKEVLEAKNKRDEALTARSQWQAALAKMDSSPFDRTVSKAEGDYHEAVQQSPLHSYAGMLFGKDSQTVTEGEVKRLEWYLLLIPSIAAALSSTLVAMTAVHRIRQPKVEPAARMPDEALTFLLGPLVQTLQQEAKNAIAGAMKTQTNQPTAKPSVESTKA